jgi:hypothetical protein
MRERNPKQQQPGIYNPVIWRLELQNSENPSRDTYIQAFGQLVGRFCQCTHKIAGTGRIILPEL